MIQTSVIVPCLNEEKTIAGLLGGVCDQTYPCEQMEVIIADGLSADRTRSIIAEFQVAHPELQIKIVDNPVRTIPAGLNKAIYAASGTYLVRLDAHSVPARDYIEKCIRALEDGKGENVGGIWLIQPGAKTWVARSIARAASHPLGAGDARYRIASTAGYVETVPFGAFRRALVDKIGPYDESLLTNEDYEFNNRILQSGGKIWLDPDIHSEYFARPTFSALANQYWRYGRWKAQMLKRNPKTLRLRQAIPPLFVLGLIALILLAFVHPLFRVGLAAYIGFYLTALFITSGIIALQNRYLPFIIGILAAVSVMHVCWGSGMLLSFINPPTAR